MSTWRHHKIKHLFAIVALVATVLHVGLTSSHFIMRAMPAVAASKADANLVDKLWSTQIGAVICHGAGMLPDDASTGGDGPAAPVQTCPVCTAVHAAVAIDSPASVLLSTGWFVPASFGVASQRAVIQRDALPFKARGPPVAA